MISSLRICSEELECAFGLVGKILDEQDFMEFVW
jgi:hypothetical protein